MKHNIKAGYHLLIDSWENDLDSFKSVILSGLSKVAVEFYIDLLKNFVSASCQEGAFGNEAVDDNKLVVYVNGVLSRHRSVADEISIKYNLGKIREDFDKDAAFSNYVHESYYRLITDLLGLPESEYYRLEHNFCRVFEGINVYFMPDEIINVTNQFYG